MQAYDHLAEWFEFLNDDCDYPSWSQYFIEGLSRLGAGRRGLEVGCGSGYFCRALARCGYEMTGADVSAAMLSVGARKAGEEGVNVTFIQADAARLPKKKNLHNFLFDLLLFPRTSCIIMSSSAHRGSFK